MDLLNQIHPYDFFEISCPHHLSSEQQKVLQLCYQPIIGVDAVSLYLKLWAEIQIQEDHQGFHHHYLLDSLGFTIKKLFQARITLEAIGLLDTYVKKNDSGQQYIYRLKQPLSAAEFFNDSVLSISLMRKLDQQAFIKLRERFLPREKNLFGYKKISRGFGEVFVSLNDQDYASLLAIEKTLEPINSISTGYDFEYNQFDFKLFMEGLNNALIPEKIFTPEIKIVIAKLAFLYNYSPIDMQKIVMLALNEDDTLSRVKLENKAHDYFVLSGTKKAPSLLKRFDVVDDEEDKHEKRLSRIKSKEGLIEYLDKTSPIQVFKDINNVLPTESIVMAINNYIRKGYSYGVINALIHYISLNSELGYNIPLMDSIMSSWIGQKVTNAEEAMEVAAKQYNHRRKDIPPKYEPKVQKPDIQHHKEIEKEYIDYELSSPFEFLKILTKGATPIKRHVVLSDQLVKTYQIPIGVTNVIIEHAWHLSNGALPEALVETIAAEVRAQGCMTAKDAKHYLSNRNQQHKPKIQFVPQLDILDAIPQYDYKTPYEFLKKLYKGQEPVRFVLNVAEELVLVQQMPIGVVNVLMEYAMKETAGKITKNFVQATAGNWMLQSLTCAKDALAHIEREKTPQTSSKLTLDTVHAFRAKQKDLQKWLPAYDEVLPYEFLKGILKTEPIPYLVNIAEDLVLNHGMQVGVINAVYEYVLSANRGRVGKNTIHSIAFNLQLQKIELAKDALEYINNYYIKEKVQVEIMPNNLRQFYPTDYMFNEDYAKYEKFTPYEFIKQLNDDMEPFTHTVSTAEKLITQKKMLPATVNYLLEYVTVNTDGALPEKYINSVADSWLRNKVTTIDEAKVLIAERERNRRTRMGKKVGVVPDWFKKEKENINERDQRGLSGENVDIKDEKIDFEQKRQELLSRLNRG